MIEGQFIQEYGKIIEQIANVGKYIVENLEGIIGVILGAILGYWAQEIKEKRQMKRLIKQIPVELKANQQLIPYKRENIKIIKNALIEGRIQPAVSTPFITNLYDTYINLFYPYLPDKQLYSLHTIYHKLKHVDDAIQKFEDNFIKALSLEKIKHPENASYSRLDDLLAILDSVEKLITAHLSGKPVDIFPSNSN